MNMCIIRKSDGQDSTCTVTAAVQHPLHGFQQVWLGAREECHVARPMVKT